MKPNHSLKRKFFVVSAAIVTLGLFQNCSKANFDGTPNASVAAASPTAPNSKATITNRWRPIAVDFDNNVSDFCPPGFGCDLPQNLNPKFVDPDHGVTTVPALILVVQTPNSVDPSWTDNRTVKSTTVRLYDACDPSSGPAEIDFLSAASSFAPYMQPYDYTFGNALNVANPTVIVSSLCLP